MGIVKLKSKIIALLITACILMAFLTGCGEAPLKSTAAYGPGEAAEHIRFYNGKICTMENGSEIVEGELWIENGRVSYTGPEKTPEKSFDLEIDLNGNLIIPGFKNAHAHSPMTFLRSYADDLNLQDWLNTKIFPMEAQLEEGDVYNLYRLAVLEYVSSGITAAFDMYIGVDEMAQAAVDSGFRCVMSSPFNDFMSSIEETEKEYLKFNKTNELVSYHLGIHAEYTTSPELISKVAKLSEKYKAPVFFHGSETADEVAECEERHGMTPVEYLNSMGIMEYGGGVFHGVHLTDREFKILKEKGYSVVTNPSSNSKLASGIAPVQGMLDFGIPVSIGTDGPSSNNALDMFREMYLAGVLQKIDLDNPTALPAEKLLEMATVTGAQTMQLNECDSLGVGKYADLIVVDLQMPNMQPEINLVNNLVYAGGKQNIILTMVNGRILYKDGEYYVGEEPEKIYEKAQDIFDKMEKR